MVPLCAAMPPHSFLQFESTQVMSCGGENGLANLTAVRHGPVRRYTRAYIHSVWSLAVCNCPLSFVCFTSILSFSLFLRLAN